MSSELCMDNSTQSMIKNEEQIFTAIKAPQNLTVILPAYNEEVSIGSIVLLSKLYADSVIVVDDGSSDRTAEIARKAGAEVIIHEVNRGKGGALKTGFTAAASLGADIIVTMDSDGQHNPADIPKLVDPIIRGEADIVNGSRYINGLDRNTPAYRRFGQKILDRFTNLNSGLKITDSLSGFRAFAASTKDAFRFTAEGMAIESEMLADAGKAGFRTKEVEIGARYDVECSTLNPIKHGFEVFAKILRAIELEKPLFCFTVPGTLLVIAGLSTGAYFLHVFISGGNLYFGPTILMVLLTVVGSFLALIGILLHSMSTIIRDIKGV